MSKTENGDIAEKLLAAMRQGADPDAIAALFSYDMEFEIPGDDGALPWLGRKTTGRAVITGFVRGLRNLTEPVKFNVQDLLTSDTQAVIVGELATRMKATGKVVESPFAIILTISDGKISRYRMLEDSFSVSRVAKA
jgi:ketosteroid isomerase-like protein